MVRYKTVANQKMAIEEELKNTQTPFEVTNTERAAFIKKYKQMVADSEITNVEPNPIFNTSGDARWVNDNRFHVQRTTFHGKQIFYSPFKKCRRFKKTRILG